MGKKISLRIDDKDIPMNAFVKKIFYNIISSMLDSLDKLPEKKEKIEIMITNKEKD